MTIGTNVLDSYVPDVDATVVSRILDAGGCIVGKAVCEAMCYNTLSCTSNTGPVLNPHDKLRMTGGSSSGCAALVSGVSLCPFPHKNTSTCMSVKMVVQT